MDSFDNEKANCKGTKRTAITVTELDSESAASVHTVQSPQLQHLPPKRADIHRKFLWRNVAIIGAFVVTYGFTVFFATYPEFLAGSFPFLSASWLTGDTSDWAPCTPFGTVPGKFDVNLSWGDLTFFQAKAIDAMWNLTVGRGLQALFAWASLELFSMGLLRIVQDSPVSLSLYTKMAFSTTSVVIIPQLIRSIWYTRGWRSKAILVWLLVSIVHLLTFPALLDLSTGYISSQNAMLRTDDRGQGTYTKLIPMSISELNFNSSIVCSDGKGHTDTCTGWPYFCANSTAALLRPWDLHCTINMTAGSNISIAEVIQLDKSTDTANWIYQDTDHQERPLKCDPGVQYSWGFSSGYLWIFSTLTSVWTLGMMAFASGYSGVQGDTRATTDTFSTSRMYCRKKLGPDTCMYSNQELAARAGKIGFVGFDVVADEHDRGHIGLAEKPSGCSHTHLAGVEFGCKTRLGRKSATWPIENDSNIEQRTGQPDFGSAALWELSRRPSTSSVASGTTSISRYPSLYKKH